jgi:hypothetical protein
MAACQEVGRWIIGFKTFHNYRNRRREVSKLFRLSLIYGFTWIVAVGAGGHALAQAQVRMDFLSKDQLVIPKNAIQQVLIQKKKKIIRALIIYEDQKRKLVFPKKKPVTLPYLLTTLLAKDGQTILQFGDQADKIHPRRTNLHWLNADGSKRKDISDYYAEEALVALSDQGFTAVAGSLANQRSKHVVDLYSRSGDKKWEFPLQSNQRAALLAVTQAAAHTIVATTDRQYWLKNHQLHILNANATSIHTFDDFNIIQKIVVLNKGKHIFVQGYDDYGLVDTATGTLLWKNDAKIRMVSPYAAKMAPDEAALFIIQADYKGRTKPAYRWNLMTLNVADGSQLQSVWLPDEYPSTWHEVFEEVSSDRVVIQADSQRVTYSWTKTGGGN